MYNLLMAFLKAKYNLDYANAKTVINEAEKSGELSDWYQIAIIKTQEEMIKNCKPKEVV